jgi:dTDP-4-amino-4,6-dideoxygalactose transaminase
MINPGYTFVASISSIIMCRAIPILAEVDESLTLDPEDVEKKITPRTKAIMAVHMLGNPCHLGKLQEIANKHHLLLIEDTAQAFGGAYGANDLTQSAISARICSISLKPFGRLLRPYDVAFLADIFSVNRPR